MLKLHVEGKASKEAKCAYGHIETFEYVRDKTLPIAKYVELTCKYGYLKLLKHLHRNCKSALDGVSAEAGSDAWREACVNNHLEVAKWLYEIYNPAQVYGIEILRIEVQLMVYVVGYLELARWLHTTLGLTRENVTVVDNYVLRVTCEKGRLEFAKWLHATYSLTPEDAKAENNEALRHACKGGHLEIAKWLHETYGLTQADARTNDNEALRHACSNGHLEVAKWLCEMYSLTVEDAKPALRMAREEGRIEVVQWLCDTYGIIPEEG